MELQIVDVEASQVSHGQPDWCEAFRQGRERLDGDASCLLQDVNARLRSDDGTFVVWLWCRAADGSSACLVLCDARRELYWRVREGRDPQLALRAVRAEMGAGPATAEVAELCTTAGWHSDPAEPLRPRRWPWLRFSLTNSWQVQCVKAPGARSWLRRASTAPLFDVHSAHCGLDLRTDALRRFGARPGGWLRLPPELWAKSFRPQGSSCDSMLQVLTAELQGTAFDAMAMAPLRVLSFDLECFSASGAFPLAHLAEDAIITVGLYTKSLGRDDARCVMLCLQPTEVVPEESWGMDGRELRCFDTEEELLLAFAAEVRALDADVVVGYNTCSFDWRYFGDRVYRLWLGRHRAALAAAALAAAAVPLEAFAARFGAPQGVPGLLLRDGAVGFEPGGAGRAEAARPGARAFLLAEGAVDARSLRSELRRLHPELRELCEAEKDWRGRSSCSLERALRLLGFAELADGRFSPAPPPEERPRRGLTLRERDACLQLARRRHVATAPLEQELASSALGDNPLCYPRTPGRVNLDLWLYLKRENVSELENLKLNTVSKHYLKDEKRDLPAKEMFKAYLEGPRGRGRVAAYCRQDCKLVLDLVEKLEALPSIWEMAKVVSVTPEDVLFRGQQIKVYTQLVLTALANGYVVEDRRVAEDGLEEAEEKYEGATVVEPTPGFYREPVFCLDFASLYPSLMRTKNLSPDALVGGASAVPVNVVAVREGVEHRFVRSSVHVGLLPRILDQLLTERKRVKKLMQTESDAARYALLNSKQLALKISANSVYGACGATKGRLSCRECAEATTAAGREAIAFTCAHISAKPGYRIVYGDTDSAFLCIPPERHEDPLPQLFELGERLAAEVTQAIESDMQGETSFIKLEFEKMLRPLILYRKKRYAGLCFEEPEKPPKILAKGLELVRKDAPAITKQAQRDVIDALLRRADVEGAVRRVVEALRQVLCLPPGGPFQLLKQSKSLRADYKDETSQAHFVVNDLQRRREAGSEARVGDRVEFVVVASAAARVVDKVEDVAFAEARGLPPDWMHYFEAVERPLMRLLEVPLGSVQPARLLSLREECDALRHCARLQTQRHGMARLGLEWRHGVYFKGACQPRLLVDQGFKPPTEAQLRRAPPPTPAQKRARKQSLAAQAVGSLDAFIAR